MSGSETGASDMEAVNHASLTGSVTAYDNRADRVPFASEARPSSLCPAPLYIREPVLATLTSLG